MKHTLLLIVLTCLIFVGCSNTVDNISSNNSDESIENSIPSENSQDATSQTESSLAESSVNESSNGTVSDEESSAADSSAIEDTTVTVYLLKKANMFDSGYVQYGYDDYGNLDYYSMYNMDRELISSSFFDDKNDNGMACKIRTEYISGDIENIILEYNEDGRIKEKKYTYAEYCGFQYEYDDKGNLTEIREYYDGILENMICYEYDNKTLKSVHCEDANGETVFDCVIENGRIIKEIHDSDSDEYSFNYKYDQNGNLIESTFEMDGEVTPSYTYEYETIEVDSESAMYIMQQQYFILWLH